MPHKETEEELHGEEPDLDTSESDYLSTVQDVVPMTVLQATTATTRGASRECQHTVLSHSHTSPHSIFTTAYKEGILLSYHFNTCRN